MKTTFPWPRISLVTPSYNQGQYLAETIESVLGQDYPDLEYFVIDGGSTDNTLSVLDRYRGALSGWVSEPDRGQGDALNKGFAWSSGQILGWLNSDDRLAPDALKAIALAFMHSEPDIVAGICEVYEEQRLIHRHLTCNPDGPLDLPGLLDLDNGWNAGQFFYQPEVFFSRRIWEKAGSRVDPSLHYSMDYELWLRFALHGARLQGIGHPVAWFRAHPDQKTANSDGFKSELVEVRNTFVREHGLEPRPDRPAVNWARRLRVAMLNDLGARYGAGIAHARIAAALDLAGHEVEFFMLIASEPQHTGFDDVLARVRAFSPDIVICGNLHGAGCTTLELLGKLGEIPIFWLTHDFWLLTGRCAYMGDCVKYLDQCDAACPTADEYPVLEPSRIAPAWRIKWSYLTKAAPNLTVLANSDWAARRFGRALRAGQSSVSVERISLGVPETTFRILDRGEQRKALGIEPEAFAIAFSVSSLSEVRKGGQILQRALQQLRELDDLVLLLIGNADQEFDSGGLEVRRLGYIREPEQLVSILNAADLFVGPSIEETFGQVFTEAAMCGLPSIGFDTSGVRDAIIDNITGMKVPDLTPEALAKAICQLHADDNQRKRLSATAPIIARSMFSLEASYRSLFLALDRAGLVDRLGLPHKISFGRNSERLGRLLLGQSERGWAGRFQSRLRHAAVRLIGLFPPALTGRVRRSLPGWIERRVVQWLIGRDLV